MYAFAEKMYITHYEKLGFL